MKRGITVLFCWTVIALGLAGCSGTKEKLGLVKEAPDEFRVVKHAPLEMPPGYALRPPAPGTPRPQEQTPDIEAKQTIFGEQAAQQQQTAPSSAEDVLLQQADADIADPQIRQKINQEFEVLNENEKTVVEKLTGIVQEDDVDASIVDAKAEAQRIKENIESGKPITEGETPSIED